MFAPDYLVPRGLPVAEFAIILVFAMTGAMLLAGATDLLLLFIGLELMVLPGYLLAGFHKTDAYSTEGAIKYFLLGSFSSAIFLFGLAFVWGMTGTTRVDEVAAAFTEIVAGTLRSLQRCPLGTIRVRSLGTLRLCAAHLLCHHHTPVIALSGRTLSPGWKNTPISLSRKWACFRPAAVLAALSALVTRSLKTCPPIDGDKTKTLGGNNPCPS
jgi:NADH-quinone oxidoreductase subunit N